MMTGRGMPEPPPVRAALQSIPRMPAWQPCLLCSSDAPSPVALHGLRHPVGGIAACRVRPAGLACLVSVQTIKAFSCHSHVPFSFSCFSCTFGKQKI